MPRVICCNSKDEILQTALNDTNLSLKALGLLYKLLVREDDITTMFKIKSETLDGATSISTAFKELQRLGYLKLERNVLKEKTKIESLYKLGVFK